MQSTSIQSIAEALEYGRQRNEPPTWRALAEALDMHATHLANAKSGTQKLTAEQLGKLAALIEEDPAELWELQAIEHLRKKNPFRAGVAAIGTLLGTFIAAVLIAGAGGLNRSQATEKAAKNCIEPMHIVALLLQKTYTAVRTLCLIFGQLVPMVAK